MAKILIVEDDPLISRMYQRVFSFEGFDVKMARNGQEGVDTLKHFIPDLMLLDIMMPKMSGIDVLKKIKADDADKKVKNIPVIVLTNLSSMKDAETAIELGAIKFIVKSDNKPTDVVRQVREILKASTRDEIPEAVESSKKKK